MASSLTNVGIFWSCFSLAAALICCTGYYLPFWIQGKLFDKVDTYFGSFRRCTYPRLAPDGSVEVVQECGVYTTFSDIPSIWWQITTVVTGIGASLSLLIAITTVAACCMTEVIHMNTARIAGGLQLLSGVLISSGTALYPLGWNSREVKEACGLHASSYSLGDCQLSWSIYLQGFGVFLLLVCLGLSFKASRIKPGSVRI